jgi:hypothetical protein
MIPIRSSFSRSGAGISVVGLWPLGCDVRASVPGGSPAIDDLARAVDSSATGGFMSQGWSNKLEPTL